ncbi:MAG: hypothetical protein J1E99_06315 [Muribaculaceae bacterium]|nr:hypothetical protein [Muribaculaceae bacterium]
MTCKISLSLSFLFLYFPFSVLAENTSDNGIGNNHDGIAKVLPTPFSIPEKAYIMNGDSTGAGCIK